VNFQKSIKVNEKCIFVGTESFPVKSGMVKVPGIFISEEQTIVKFQLALFWHVIEDEYVTEYDQKITPLGFYAEESYSTDQGGVAESRLALIYRRSITHQPYQPFLIERNFVNTHEERFSEVLSAGSDNSVENNDAKDIQPDGFGSDSDEMAGIGDDNLEEAFGRGSVT